MTKLLLWLSIFTLISLSCGISASMQLPSPSDAPAPSNPRVFARELDESTLYTVTGYLNIRTGAGESFPALRETLQAGDTVTCLEWVGVWCRHEEGWSNSSWLQVVK